MNAWKARLRLTSLLVVATLIATPLAMIAATGPAASASSGKVTLVLANSQWLDKLRGTELWNAMLQFEKVDPNVTLVQEAIPGPTIATELTAKMGAGKGPDVMMISQDSAFYPFAAAGWLVPIPASVTKGVALNKTNDAAFWKGVRLGVAWQQAPFGMMYNKAIFAKAGLKTFPLNEKAIHQ